MSHNNFKDQIDSVNNTLKDIKATNKPLIMIFNKVDLYNNSIEEIEIKENIKKLKKTWMGKIEKCSIFISAEKKINIENFKKTIYSEIRKIHIRRFPYNDFLYSEY